MRGRPGDSGAPVDGAEGNTRRIDHVVHAVPDLHAAATEYEAMGFVVTPRADHPFGTSNHLIVLRDSYIELVTVTDPLRLPEKGFAREVADHLTRIDGGIPFVVLASDDPETDRTALASLVVGDLQFSRPAPLPDGSTVVAAFTCLLTDGTPDVGVFYCHHHHPESVWSPAALAHPNGASTLVSTMIPMTESSTLRLAEFVGTVPIDGVVRAGATSISAGRAAVTVGTHDPAEAHRHVAGVEVSIRQIEQP